jgi:hypothetical protein
MNLRDVKVGDLVRVSSIREVHETDLWYEVVATNDRYITAKHADTNLKLRFGRANGMCLTPSMSSKRISGHETA